MWLKNHVIKTIQRCEFSGVRIGFIMSVCVFCLIGRERVSKEQFQIHRKLLLYMNHLIIQNKFTILISRHAVNHRNARARVRNPLTQGGLKSFQQTFKTLIFKEHFEESFWTISYGPICTWFFILIADFSLAINMGLTTIIAISWFLMH